FRAGNDGHAAWITSNWSDGPDSFTKKWEEWNQAGLRMIDLETWEEGGARIWCGIFRAGSWAHAAWIGVDWENFTAMWNQQARNGMRLFDLEVYPSPCGNDCMNQVVMPGDACETDPPGNCVYNYWLPGGADHCEAEPGNCTGSSIGQGVWYRQPIDIFENNQRFARLSALYVEEQIFSLPFSKDEGEMGHNGWLYSPGSWHHAIDYWKKGGGTFKVRAAAPGRVIWIGWDRWSGNTVVMSHDAGGVKDKYRTIYMHLRNGPDNDCSQAWNQTVSWLSTWEDLTVYNNYKSYLNDSGCKQNSAQRNLDEARWGNDAQTINAGLLGQDVQAGTALGYAGDTGPGGCGCSTGGKGPNTHLHVFFAHRDPENNLWYFFDPYGVYGIPSCYPAGQTDFPGACTRYPVAWRGGRPQYPEDLPPLKILFRLGDSSGDGEFDITDCISTLQCLFLGLNCSRCPVAADVDNNGEVDLTDAINSLYCLFRGTDCFGLNDRRCDYDRNEDDRLGCNDAAPCLIR
ncbi:MAG: hypothetical protein HY717_22695, partial [Planctomycetes bacterium]|nr:hypothetical protein [Planctomycetota bacterium]